MRMKKTYPSLPVRQIRLELVCTLLLSRARRRVGRHCHDCIVIQQVLLLLLGLGPSLHLVKWLKLLWVSRFDYFSYNLQHALSIYLFPFPDGFTEQTLIRSYYIYK